MELSLLFLVLTMLWKTAWSVQCFECFPEESFYDKSKLSCQHFDGSDKYIVDCDKSTMCFKRVTTLNLGNDLTSTSVHRGCASQSLGFEQVKVNRKWEQKVIVHDEIYDEACIEDHYDLEKPTKTVKCHCRGNYCNGSTKFVNFNIFILLIVHFIIYIIS